MHIACELHARTFARRACLSAKRNIRNECAILIRRVKGMLREECGYAPCLTLRHWTCIYRYTCNNRAFSIKNVQAPPKRDIVYGWKGKRFFRFFRTLLDFHAAAVHLIALKRCTIIAQDVASIVYAPKRRSEGGCKRIDFERSVIFVESNFRTFRISVSTFLNLYTGCNERWVQTTTEIIERWISPFEAISTKSIVSIQSRLLLNFIHGVL